MTAQDGLGWASAGRSSTPWDGDRPRDMTRHCARQQQQPAVLSETSVVDHLPREEVGRAAVDSAGDGRASAAWDSSAAGASDAEDCGWHVVTGRGRSVRVSDRLRCLGEAAACAGWVDVVREGGDCEDSKFTTPRGGHLPPPTGPLAPLSLWEAPLEDKIGFPSGGGAGPVV